MKTAVIYWSGTGNTEQMASAIAEGAGAELFTISEFNGDMAAYDRIAFGCPPWVMKFWKNQILSRFSPMLKVH